MSFHADNMLDPTVYLDERPWVGGVEKTQARYVLMKGAVGIT